MVEFLSIFSLFIKLVRSLKNLVKLPSRTMIWSNNTTTTSLPSSTTWHIDGPSGKFQYISPLNIMIAVYIMIQNSIIIYDYHKDWKRISSLFFILVAIVDIGSACFEIGRGSISLMCLNNPSMRMHPWTFIVVQLFGTLCYVTSTFFVVALTVVKTINIMRPFYSQNYLVLKIILFIYSCILLVLCIIDVWVEIDIHKKYNDSPQCGVVMGPWNEMTYIESIGTFAPLRIIMFMKRYFELHKGAVRLIHNVTQIVVPLVQFGLPWLIVLLCMVLQMIYIKKAFRGHENPQLNTANQVNLTVFLISMLYLISISLYCLLTYPLGNYVDYLIPGPILLLVKFTLPLINAALFPTILILRKSEMRARYRNYIAKVLLLPLTIYAKVRYLAQRRRGYTEIRSNLPT